MKKILAIIGCMFFIACGQIEEQQEQERLKAEQREEEKAAKAQEKQEVQAQKEAADKEAKENLKPIKFEGYLLSAFDISVDGEIFTDSEDFYTKQLARLEKEVNDAGYKGYSYEFDAEIGLNDLKNGMHVYIAPVQDKGHAGEALIGFDGKFYVYLPSAARGETVKVRANKRVGVTITGPKGDVIQWCYNFSAKESNIEINKDAKPIVLDTFSTKMTKYKCEKSESGIKIEKQRKMDLNQAVAEKMGGDKEPAVPVAEAAAVSDATYYKEYAEDYLAQKQLQDAQQ